MNELDQKYVTRFSKIDSNYITLYHLPFDTLPIFSSKLTPWFDLYLVWREVTLRELKSWSLIFEHLTHRHFSKEFRSAVDLLWLVKCQVQFKLLLYEQLTKDSYRNGRNTPPTLIQNLKPIEISKNHFNIIWISLKVV